MGTSSINIQGVKVTSEKHNKREVFLDYVREDLSNQNEGFEIRSISETLSEIESNYLKNVGQKMQAKSTPIREAVLLIEEKHGIDDLKKLSQELESRFGIRAIQGYIHRDEGHYDDLNQWKPNLHAHLVFDWTQPSGKSIKLNKQDMSEMQSIVAKSLGMQRGESSDKKHLNSLQFKNQKERARLEEKLKVSNLLDIKEKIEEQTEWLKIDYKYLEKKKEKLQKELEELSKQIEKNKEINTNKNRGIRF